MNKTRYKTNYIVHDNGEVFKITKNGLKKKKVLWNGTIYDSATELSYYLGLKRNACCESIRVGRKLKGHYAKYI